MPYLKLNTNVDVSPEQSQQLLVELSGLLARETSKPERYVMVEVLGGQAMLFGGSAEPLAYLECKSIGLSSAQAKALASSIPKLLAGSISSLVIAPRNFGDGMARLLGSC